MRQSRFMMELTGELGDFWKMRAKEELGRVRKELDNGEITIDGNGVARNCIGRVLMDDMVEKVALLTDAIDADATRAERDRETDAFLAEYRERMKNHKPSEEELFEMRAAFGPGETVVDVLSGQIYHL